MRRRGDLFAPAIVLTGHQTAGRGRRENAWWSACGCLTVTFVFPIDPQVPAHQFPLTAGVAIRNAAAELTGNADIQLKWPNDLLHHGRKLAGLLCERAHGVDLVGLGMNVNLDPAAAPPNLRYRITSLSSIQGKPCDPTAALIAIARRLRQTLARLAQGPFAQLLREYDVHHALIGRRVQILQGGEAPALVGKVEGLDEMGRLLLRTRDKLEHVISGQVILFS